MSDLISRSELIENFRKCYSGHLGMENSDACMTFHGICNVINNTNTAYDVDKVVEELDNSSHWTESSFDEDGYSNDDSEEVLYLNDAIEIVKQGGISDNVCEWEYDYKFVSDKYKRETGCGHTFYDLHHAVPFKHCPYCGKKIKIVGD